MVVRHLGTICVCVLREMRAIFGNNWGNNFKPAFNKKVYLFCQNPLAHFYNFSVPGSPKHSWTLICLLENCDLSCWQCSKRSIYRPFFFCLFENIHLCLLPFGLLPLGQLPFGLLPFGLLSVRIFALADPGAEGTVAPTKQ